MQIESGLTCSDLAHQVTIIHMSPETGMTELSLCRSSRTKPQGTIRQTWASIGVALCSGARWRGQYGGASGRFGRAFWLLPQLPLVSSICDRTLVVSMGEKRQRLALTHKSRLQLLVGSVLVRVA